MGFCLRENSRLRPYPSRQRRSVLGLLLFLVFGLGAPLGAAEFDTWGDTRVQVFGDFIGGYFDDRALMGSAGRETQSFKMSRGILGIDVERSSGLGGVLEYNVFPDEPRREDGDRRTNFDFYNNLGTDLLYFGQFKVRNGYLRYRHRGWLTLRAGRMVNIIGFEEAEVPFWGRNDSPHAHFLTKEILTGAAAAFDSGWLRFEAAVLSGQGRPDRDYNWYLNGLTDPNTNGNSDPLFEGQALLRLGPWARLNVGYHSGKTGSAVGSIYSGKHNDDRVILGFRGETPDLGPWFNRLMVWGQYSRFTVGLTENGVQGNGTPLESRDLRKDGWFITGGIGLFRRVSVYVTYEELDRIDALVWKEVTGFDPTHPAFESIERSTIFQIDTDLNPWVRLSGFYRYMDFDYGEISGIDPETVAARDYDKMGLVLRVRF